MNNNRKIEKVTCMVNGVEFTFVGLPAGYGCEAFWLAETHTTVGQWNAVMPDDRRAGPDDWPVTQVSFEDAWAFCGTLWGLVGAEARLPTNEEFCRALGEEPINLADYAVFGQSECQPVGTKLPNEYGLRGMRGSVWHWLARRKYREGQSQYLRGGSWSDTPIVVRAISRSSSPPTVRYGDVGFRVCCVARPPGDVVSSPN
jgi:formylglycine-generating enzyme required for sulfatase activity